MTRMKSAVAVVLVSLLFAVTGCSSSSETGALPKGAVVIDVRTPAEYTEGHLEGAVNVDVESSEFIDTISSYDPTGTYIVYCRSGNRSAAAVSHMESMGFTDVTNAGGMDAASNSTGLPVVTG